ncbi:MAG: tetratricopeptide repeat protein [Spirochaetaceae bacterium]|jgi:TPR repeat protein|nr:tetratricopeptide repeat protein [Spirochaetaceae bacterium]
MKKTIIVLLMALCTVCVFAQTTAADYRAAAEAGNAEAQYNLGRCYQLGRGVERDRTKAFEWCLKAANQGYADAQYYVGFYYRRGWGVEQDAAKGESWNDKAAAQGNKLALSFQANKAYNDASESHDKGDIDKAIAGYTTAVKLNPEHSDAYWRRAIAYMNKGDYDKAIPDYTQVIKLSPEASNAYYFRGFIYSNLDKHDLAINDYTKALELGLSDENTASAYNNRGWAYFEKGNYDKCIDDCTQAIKADPNFVYSYGSRAEAYLKKNNIGGALSDYSKIAQLTVEDKNYNKDLLTYNMGAISDTENTNTCAGAAVYMEMQVGKFLGQDTTRYQSMLGHITARGNVTQGEIEGFVREGIAAVVDAEFSKVYFMIDKNYNAELSYNSTTKKYLLIYEGVSDIDEIIASSLSDLRTKMTNTRDFTAAGVNATMKEAEVIPLVVYTEWKQKGVAGGTDAIALVKEAITSFFLNPNKNTYSALTGISARFWISLMYQMNSLVDAADTAFLGSLQTLSSVLWDKVTSDINNMTANAMAKIPNDTRYNIFSMNK